MPTVNSQPTGIALGHDGALWFTEYSANQIGRITTAGVVRERRVPTAKSEPDGIAAGPDGALWFTEYSGNSIGRITTAGAITEYAIPTPDSQSVAIAAGPEGALWFTENHQNNIGRITTAGVITEFPVDPCCGTGPDGIAAGPDGALWFTQDFAIRIARMTTSGVFSRFYSPPVGLGITAGPDGALWFTEPGTGSIGRAPACALGLTASFAGSTLTVSFDLGIDTPATWFGGLQHADVVTPLWSKAIPAVVPPKPVTLTFDSGIPSENPSVGCLRAGDGPRTGTLLRSRRC